MDTRTTTGARARTKDYILIVVLASALLRPPHSTAGGHRHRIKRREIAVMHLGLAWKQEAPDDELFRAADQLQHEQYNGPSKTANSLVGNETEARWHMKASRSSSGARTVSGGGDMRPISAASQAGETQPCMRSACKDS
eukprot:scaffold253058_cov30-Prasinocladus_malaysianus.AAC.1